MIYAQNGALEKGSAKKLTPQADGPPIEEDVEMIVFNIGLGPGGMIQIAVEREGAEAWHRGLGELLAEERKPDIQVARSMPPGPRNNGA